AIDAPGRVRKLVLLEPPLLSLVPSGGQFTEWVASVREIYDSGDKTAAMDMVLAGAYGQDYRRFTDVALPAGASTARYPISTRTFRSNSGPCNTGISQPKA